MTPPSLAIATAFADYGFGVFSVWGIADGTCLCPKGATCDSPGKHPIPHDGFKSATTDPAAIEKMLGAAGSNGNYGVFPAQNVVMIDVDGEGWQAKMKGLGLPKTFAVVTPNGCHLYYWWDPIFGSPPTYLFGWKVRSREHPGYVVGPGSTHQTGQTYRIAGQNGHTVYEMFGELVPFPKTLLPPGEAIIRVSEGLRLPETVTEGGRHDYLRDRARTLRGGGLTGDDLFNAVSALNRRFEHPKTDEEVRRAIGDVETKFGEDPVPIDAKSIPSSELFAHMADYLAAQPNNIVWVSPLAAYGFVSLVSGPPKSGKSTLIANLFGARERNEVFLWGDPVPEGPAALVTEEGGYAVVRKTKGLTKLHILDRLAFVSAGLSTFDHLLEVTQRWCQTQEGAALIVIDTLAVWGDIKDENDAVAATKTVAKVALLARATGAAIVLVHHARKGGGEHGEAIRGSGAIFATVDQAIELGYGLDPKADDRLLSVTGRITFGENKRLVFDRDKGVYSLDMAPLPDEFEIDQFPVDGGPDQGFTREDAEKVWGAPPSTTNKRLKLLVTQKRLVKAIVRLPGERADRAVYWKQRPLLDVRSVSERMADIFKPGVEDE